MRALEAAEATYRRDGPRVRDATAVTFGAFLTVLAVKTPWSAAPRPIILLAGLAGSVGLWWRRRWPVSTALLGTGAFLLSGNPWPPMVGLSTTAAQRRDRVPLVVGVTLVAGVGFGLPVMADLGRFDLSSLVSGIGEAVFVALVGTYLGTRQELLASLRDRAERAESERELRDEQARAGERARIAREMHDVLAHKVSLIALHAGALEVSASAEPHRVEEAGAVIRTTAHQALGELRTVLGVLHGDLPPRTHHGLPGGSERDVEAATASDGFGGDELLSPQPQAADIGRLVEASRRAGLAVELDVALPPPSPAAQPSDEPEDAGRAEQTGRPGQVERPIDPGVPELPGTTARTVYRVVQEGLTNVHKHAPGASTEVTIGGDERAGITISVTNGPAASPEPLLPGSSAGLVGLGERLRLAGGTLSSGPAPDGGWALRAWLPWSTTATEMSWETRHHEPFPTTFREEAG